MTDNTLSATHSIVVYVGSWLFLLAIAFHDKPIFFYPLIGGAAIAVNSVLGSFILQQYRCYLYAKKAVMYGANGANYYAAARGSERGLEIANTDKNMSFLKRFSPEEYRRLIDDRIEKANYYRSCADHCRKRQKFYIDLMISEGMDRDSTIEDTISASIFVASRNPVVEKMHTNPKDKVNVDAIVKAIEKVEG